jgi:hypothetical protein
MGFNSGFKGLRVNKSNNIFSLDFLALEDGTDNLPRNVGKKLPIYAA